MFVYDINEEITLKTLAEHDAHELFQLIDGSREYLREWLPWIDTNKSVCDSVEFIRNSKYLFDKRIGLNAGIMYKGKLVGIVGFNRIDWNNRMVQIGYWLSKDYQGKGIMTRVVTGLIDYAFEQLELNRIEIHAAYENKKSRAIPEKLGFQKEGHIRQAEWLYNHYVDHVIYGLLASDW